ncbi:MAG: tetratricopeptide repeat protein [Melioribacteraceae bacterium]
MGKEIKKEISNIQLLLTILGLSAIGIFLLIISGLFDSAEPILQHNHTTNENQQVQTPTVDLNKLKEINNLEEVVKNNPENHEALLNLAHMQNDNGFYDKAVIKYEEYLKLHPENADVIVDLGVCYFELKKYEKSISVIESALKINPTHQIAHFNLGIVNLSNGNINKAKEWWGKARDLDPNSNIGMKAEELLKTNN